MFGVKGPLGDGWIMALSFAFNQTQHNFKDKKRRMLFILSWNIFMTIQVLLKSTCTFFSLCHSLYFTNEAKNKRLCEQCPPFFSSFFKPLSVISFCLPEEGLSKITLKAASKQALIVLKVWLWELICRKKYFYSVSAKIVFLMGGRQPCKSV